jgi:hypothetical protein
MSEEKITFIVTANYTGMDASDLPSVDFVKAIESRVSSVAAYSLIDAVDRGRDHFAIYLGFASVDEECRGEFCFAGMVSLNRKAPRSEHGARLQVLLEAHSCSSLWFSPDA